MQLPRPTIDRLRRLRPAAGRGSKPIAWLSLLEMLLLAVLAVQAARLVWAVVTPVGAYGDWRGKRAEIPAPTVRQALFASFDPFFRSAGAQGGDAVVTSLALTVFGIRVNEGSGQGSAIVATPDGVQNSYAVGDEILPGVVLKAVAFDHILIDRGGSEESVFLDQSVAAPVAAPEGGAPSGSAAPPIANGGPAVPGVDSIRSDIGLAPRMQNGQVTGLVLSERGPAFAQAGFQPGDIITQVNGKPVSGAGDMTALMAQVRPGARISLSVERGGSVVPIALILQGP